MALPSTVCGRSASPRAAEMVKPLGSTFRAINIGLANEMALMCDRMGIDIWEVIDAATSGNQGVRIHALTIRGRDSGATADCVVILTNYKSFDY